MIESRIISGTMKWGIWGEQLDTKSMASLIEKCFELGINSFDHADIYGNYTTEGEFGKAFKQTNIDREKLFYISKCGIKLPNSSSEFKSNYYDYSKSYIIKQVENSLTKLKTEYLDLLLLHRPSPLMNEEEISSAIEILISDGKIKSFGVSNFNAHQINLINKDNTISFNQIEFSLSNFKPIFDGNLDFLSKNKIGIMAWGPLGKYFSSNSKQKYRIKKRLSLLKEKYNANEDELLLAWILNHPSSIYPVIGTTKKNRIERAARSTNIKMDEIDWFSLLVSSKGTKML